MTLLPFVHESARWRHSKGRKCHHLAAFLQARPGHSPNRRAQKSTHEQLGQSHFHLFYGAVRVDFERKRSPTNQWSSGSVAYAAGSEARQVSDAGHGFEAAAGAARRTGSAAMSRVVAWETAVDRGRVTARLRPPKAETDGELKNMWWSCRCSNCRRMRQAP